MQAASGAKPRLGMVRCGALSSGMCGIHYARVKRKRGDSVRYFSDDARLKTSAAGVYLLGVVASLVLNGTVAPAGEPSSRPERADPQAEPARLVVGLGEEWQKSSPDVGRTKGLADALVGASEKIPARFRPMLRIYEARGLVLLGRSPAARAAVEHGLKEQVDLPDFLLLAARLGAPDNPESGEWHRDVLDKLGAILPLSIFGRDRDSRRSGRMFEKPNPPPPKVPVSTDAKAFVQIGDTFAENGRLREAVNCWLEGLYACQLLSEHKRAGTVWIKVAQAEDRLGRETLAVRAYLRAAHEDGAHTEVASAGVARVLSGQKTDKPEARKPLDEATVSRLVGLYKRLNLHPFALSLIEKELPPSPSKQALTHSVREEWDGIVGNLVATYKAGKNSYILGHRASDVADWSKIKVPRPSDTFWKEAGAPGEVGGGSPATKSIAELVSHEVGHLLGLYHAPYVSEFVPSKDGIMGWQKVGGVTCYKD